MSSVANKLTNIIDCGSEIFSEDLVVEALKTRGFCRITNLFSEAALSEVKQRVDHYYTHPAVAGVPGYGKVDHPKKTLQPGLAGPYVYDLMLNTTIISIIERVMDSECILAEAFFKYDKGVNQVYFPMHTDFPEGWQKTKESPKLNAEQLRDPVGIGIAIYLEDCDEGAFTYCEGSHRFKATKGSQLSDYSKAEQEELLKAKVRCSGKRGDLVMFDDRGFHGPSHPSRKDRSVLLLDYYRVKTLGYNQVTPLFVRTSDINLAKLSEKQCRVLGLGAGYWTEPHEYSGTRFSQNKFYPFISYLIENAYRLGFIKSTVKKRIRKWVRRSAD